MVGSRLIAFRFEGEMKNGEGDLNFQSMGGEVLRNVVICSLSSCFFLASNVCSNRNVHPQDSSPIIGLSIEMDLRNVRLAGENSVGEIRKS